MITILTSMRFTILNQIFPLLLQLIANINYHLKHQKLLNHSVPI